MPRVVKSKAGVASGAPAAKKAAGKRNNKLYSMPEKIAEGTVLVDLSKAQWRIGESIGVGGFGEIYSACRAGEKNYDFVVKCEPHGNGPLFVEMHFYMRNARLEDIKRFQKEHGLKSLGMPYMIGNGSADIKGQKHRFIVMPRYGCDIARHFIANGRRLPEGTAYRIALQMLDVYEFVHTCGYVHADLKAANILLGYGKGGGGQSYLVDYGLASHYTTKEFKPDPKKMHNGTIEYTSRDAHQGVATMRADLEILGYNLIEWLGVELPWVKDNLLTTPVKVQKAKEDFFSNLDVNLKKLFPRGVPAPIADFMKYVAKLQYNEKPDYDKCRKMFESALKTMKIANSGDLDFKIRTTASDNNNMSPSSSKGKGRRNVKNSPVMDSSVEVCASDDDDDDVIFTRKKPVKVAPHKTLKTITKAKTKVSPVINRKSPKSPIADKISPRRKMVVRTSPSPSPSPSSKYKSKHSPPRKSPRATPLAAQPKSPSKTSQGFSPHGKKIINNTPTESTSSRPARSTPLSTNINFSPAISVKHSASRPGKTVINDCTTPKPRAGKTYEFNFELDVSMDANVVVNVKRKKRATNNVGSAQMSKANSSEKRHTSETGDDGTPVTRVKVRKLASSDDAGSNPRTPAVTVKKTKRIVQHR